MRYIRRKLIKLDTGEELDTGKQILTMFVTPKLNAEGQSQGSDYDQQRQMRKVLRYLRGNNGNEALECAIDMGEYVELEDAWYDHLMHQAKHWKYGVNDTGIADMIEEWDTAQEHRPEGGNHD